MINSWMHLSLRFKDPFCSHVATINHTDLPTWDEIWIRQSTGDQPTKRNSKNETLRTELKLIETTLSCLRIELTRFDLALQPNRIFVCNQVYRSPSIEPIRVDTSSTEWDFESQRLDHIDESTGGFRLIGPNRPAWVEFSR